MSIKILIKENSKNVVTGDYFCVGGGRLDPFGIFREALQISNHPHSTLIEIQIRHWCVNVLSHFYTYTFYQAPYNLFEKICFINLTVR